MLHSNVISAHEQFAKQKSPQQKNVIFANITSFCNDAELESENDMSGFELQMLSIQGKDLKNKQLLAYIWNTELSTSKSKRSISITNFQNAQVSKLNVESGSSRIEFKNRLQKLPSCQRQSIFKVGSNLNHRVCNVDLQNLKLKEQNMNSKKGVWKNDRQTKKIDCSCHLWTRFWLEASLSHDLIIEDLRSKSNSRRSITEFRLLKCDLWIPFMKSHLWNRVREFRFMKSTLKVPIFKCEIVFNLTIWLLMFHFRATTLEKIASWDLTPTIQDSDF